ncbi:MAG: hypothetical protein JO112_00210, partial [Planctomycetes bacterium]|nr:hypothetical protein [Planctomycetota bacterium]
MDNLPIPGRDERDVVKQFISQYDVPAYIRRARQVQEAFDQLLERCRRQREEWLRLVRTRLGLLHALAGDWERLGPWLRDEAQVELLHRLHA